MKVRKSTHALRMTVEPLENRILLHAGHSHDGNPAHDLLEVDTAPAITSVADLLDPHQFDDSSSLPPIIYDEILGIPARAGDSPTEGVALPDFFPDISSLGVDQTSQPGRTLVRFSTRVNNQGDGPAILISGRPGVDPIPTGAPITSWVNPDGSQNILQALYDFNGSSFSFSHYIAGGQFTYHEGHGHFHYDGYANYRLRENVGGVPGDYVQRADGTGTVGEKVGFCLININSSFIMENGQSSTTLPGYNRPGQPSTGCGLTQGIHVGKADVYSSGLTGQWLDVTGVPNGQYFIEIELDSTNAIAETNDANNAKTFAYTLNVNPGSGGIPADIFDQTTNNNSFDDATDMGVMGTFTQTGLTVHWGLDHDYFRFEASSSGTYTITSTQNDGDINIYLFDASQTQIAASTKPSGSESISYNFVKGETYYLRAQTYNSTVSSNYQVAWNLKPEASSLTSVGLAAEGGPAGRFVIARNGPTSSPLTVTFSLTGDAVNGVDYQAVGNSVTIGNLASEAEIDIVAIADGMPEGQESVILTITSGNAYVVGSTGSQLLITDLSGDFNLDGSLGLADIDLLTENVAIGPANPAMFDLTGDGLVDMDDINEWLALAGAANLPSGNAYLLGDANLDGIVDGFDFIEWNANKFTMNTAWSAGNFNGDAFVDGFDFIEWNARKFMSSASRPVVYMDGVRSESTKQRASLADKNRFDAVDHVLSDLQPEDSQFTLPRR